MSDVEAFIVANSLDQRASEALRGCRPEIQQAVIERGSVMETRNPSAAVLGRIRDADTGGNNGRSGIAMTGFKRPLEADASFAAPKRTQILVDRADVEQFILANSVDVRAAEAFRSCPPEVQHMVMARGNLSMTNPSSCILGRIKNAQVQLAGGQIGIAQLQAQTSSGRDIGLAVEEFIANEGLDQRAADALRTSPPAMQQVLLERGSLHGLANPSAALLARIKNVQQVGAGGAASAGPVATAAHQLANMVASLSPVEQFISANSLDETAATALRQSTPEIQQMVLGVLSQAQSAESLAQPTPTQAVASTPAMSSIYVDPQEVEQFLISQNIEIRAANAFRECPPEVQYMVMSIGHLSMQSPSSCLLGRIKNAQLELLGAGQQYRQQANSMGNGMSNGMGNGMEAAALQMQNGGYGGCGAAGGCASYGSTSPSSTWEVMSGGRDVGLAVEEFIATEGLDARAADALRTSPRAMQQVLLARGTLKGLANPSAALLARIKNVQQGGGGSQRPNIEADAADVEQFILSNPLDQAAADALRGCTPGVQQLVLARGSLASLVNPSAALLRRIQSAMQGENADAAAMQGNANLGGNGVASEIAAVVDTFILSEGLDERAAGALRSCPSTIQLAVLHRGSLAGLANPSAALLGRIKEAQLAQLSGMTGINLQM